MGNPAAIRAVDVHAHYGTARRGRGPLIDRFMTAEADTVRARAEAVGIAHTVVSPLHALMPRGRADTVAGNEQAAHTVPATPGLWQWVVINPRQTATYEQAAAQLTHPRCLGIKIHPEEHEYPIREHGEALFGFAAAHGAPILTHAGDENSRPGDFLSFADAHPEVPLILAHLGLGDDDDPTHHVRAVQSQRNENVYVDTSSARSILPGLIEWAVSEIGADRILFGTDAPLYSTAMQRARIDAADLDEKAKRRILHQNAERLLRISEETRSP